MSRATHYQVPALLERLVDPRLHAAKCTGRSPWFDAELDGETPEQRSARLAWAQHQCSTCPVQSMCRTAATEQDNPTGIWAGVLHNPAGTPGRPRKDTAA